MRTALALGSGGARGYAHIGAIEALEARGHEIVVIAGSSMGAVVGGLKAAGQLDAYVAWTSGLRQRDVFRLLDFKFARAGMLGADKVLAKLHELTGEMNIEDLAIPFTAVAADLDMRREVWFQQGPLHPAIRASFAMPGWFTPITMNGHVLVDGGVLNPLPIEPTTAVPSELTVAVSLSGPRIRTPETRRLSRAVVSGARADVDPDEVGEVADDTDFDEANLKMTEVIARSVDAMQGLIARYRTAARPPDVLVEIPINAFGSMDFHRAAEIIETGREATERALDAAGF